MNWQKKQSDSKRPRVEISYDIEVYGREQQVELPFVMGVMADLSGDGAGALPSLEEREFLSIDAATLDQRMRDAAPRLHLSVPDHLAGTGNMTVDLAFNRIDDFRPDAVARQVPALARLLEAREQLALLLTYMDGKAGAEEILAQLVADDRLLDEVAAAGGRNDPQALVVENRA